VIKLNLLPSHIFERRRIYITIAVSLALIALEWLVILKFKADVQAQQEWYTNDTSRVKDYQSKLDAYTTEETGFKNYPAVYSKWIDTFGTLQPFKDYTNQIAVTLAEAARKIGGGGAWFDDMTIDNDGKLSADGHIKGSMQFLNYYFRIRDLQADQKTMTPAVSVDGNKNGGPITVTIAWPSAATAFPVPPSLPDSTRSLYSGVFQPATVAAPTTNGQTTPGGSTGGGAFKAAPPTTASTPSATGTANPPFNPSTPFVPAAAPTSPAAGGGGGGGSAPGLYRPGGK